MHNRIVTYHCTIFFWSCTVTTPPNPVTPDSGPLFVADPNSCRVANNTVGRFRITINPGLRQRPLHRIQLGRTFLEDKFRSCFHPLRKANIRYRSSSLNFVYTQYRNERMAFECRHEEIQVVTEWGRSLNLAIYGT